MVREKSRLTPTQDDAKSYLKDRQRAYAKLFGGKGKDVKAVLQDLRRFCRAESTCFNPDPAIQNMLIGRREVWLRIREHLDLTFDELIELKKEPNNG